MRKEGLAKGGGERLLASAAEIMVTVTDYADRSGCGNRHADKDRHRHDRPGPDRSATEPARGFPTHPMPPPQPLVIENCPIGG
jgi:hypothetical protein